jgi:hypothetical protein
MPASQVGNRRYARGRAFVEDRYSNPEGAEEETLAAAAASEFGESIDNSVEETGFTDGEIMEELEERAEEPEAEEGFGDDTEDDLE